jgi:hypothetical protein
MLLKMITLAYRNRSNLNTNGQDAASCITESLARIASIRLDLGLYYDVTTISGEPMLPFRTDLGPRRVYGSSVTID